MCVVVFRWQPDSDSPLILAANRDEFFARPTQPMHWWNDADILAGRDLQSGGTWLGVTRSGRFALVTNVRDPLLRKANAPSRGLLVSSFLSSDQSAESFIASLADNAHLYEGFNLLCGELVDRSERARNLWFLNSCECEASAVMSGVHTLSNASLNTAWPKTERIKTAFTRALDIENADAQDTAFNALLTDATPADESELPNTGVPLDWERALSSVFIRHGDYGTRASTLFRVNQRTAGLRETIHARDAACESTGKHFCEIDR
jgi:uncharacterized protein with NRDE domain